MARLDEKTVPGPWDQRTRTADFNVMLEQNKKEHEALCQLLATARALPKGKVVGAIVGCPSSCGEEALYLVSNARPLTLQRIPINSCHANPIWVRGLRKQDVLDELEVMRRQKLCVLAPLC